MLFQDQQVVESEILTVTFSRHQTHGEATNMMTHSLAATAAKIINDNDEAEGLQLRQFTPQEQLLLQRQRQHLRIQSLILSLPVQPLLLYRYLISCSNGSGGSGIFRTNNNNNNNSRLGWRGSKVLTLPMFNTRSEDLNVCWRTNIVSPGPMSMISSRLSMYVPRGTSQRSSGWSRSAR